MGWTWMQAIYKALVLLVIACPCALVISTPVTVVSGLAAAARRGILIKGGIHLEGARKIKAIALDKTGTITLGKPKLWPPKFCRLTKWNHKSCVGHRTWHGTLTIPCPKPSHKVWTFKATGSLKISLPCRVGALKLKPVGFH